MGKLVIQVESLWKRYDIHPLYSIWSKAERVWQRLRRQEVKADVFWALRDVNFHVHKGEALGVIGPNGAGKSTLLKLLCGVTAPTTGTVRVDGRVAPLIELGAGFHPELTGRENVMINGVVLGMSLREIRHKYDAIVDFAELGEFMETPVKKYSVGMFARLAFAVAIHTEPDVMLVDEVLAVGDAAFKMRCAEQLNRMRRTGKTLVLVSHNLAQIKRHCDRAILLAQGCVQCVGPTQSVLEKYIGLSDGMENSSRTINLLDANTDVRIQDVQLLDQQGRPLQYAKYGEALVANIYLSTERMLYSASIMHKIYRDDGMAVTTSRTSHTPGMEIMLEGDCTVQMRIKPLLLNNGRYHIEIAVRDNAHALVAHAASSDFIVIQAPPQLPGEEADVFFHPGEWIRPEGLKRSRL